MRRRPPLYVVILAVLVLGLSGVTLLFLHSTGVIFTDRCPGEAHGTALRDWGRSSLVAELEVAEPGSTAKIDEDDVFLAGPQSGVPDTRPTATCEGVFVGTETPSSVHRVRVVRFEDDGVAAANLTNTQIASIRSDILVRIDADTVYADVGRIELVHVDRCIVITVIAGELPVENVHRVASHIAEAASASAC